MEIKDRKLKTVSGIKWSMLSQIITQGSNFLISILLTRLLTPDDFGLIAMITVFTGFLSVFQDFGLGSALIYNRKATNTDYSTIFYAHLILGFFLASMLYLLSSFISEFYDKDILKTLTRVISLSFVIQAFSYIQYTLLKKEMNFRKIFFINSISVVVSGLIAIILASQGYGVWSLIFKLIIFHSLNTLILWVVSSWRPELVFSKTSLKDAMNYSLPIMGNKTFGYFMRNTDSLLIGKFLGSSSLGIYNRAYSLMMLPINQISGVLSNVLFPSFTLINDDLELFKLNWLKVNRYLAFIVFPLCTLIIILARPFVILILGYKWLEVVPIIQILSISGIVQSLFSTLTFVYKSMNLNSLSFKVNVVTSILLIISIVLGLQKGIKGVAISYTLMTIFSLLPLGWYSISKKLNVGFNEILSNISVYFFSCIFLGFISLVVFKVLSFENHNLLVLVFTPILFITIYLMLLKILGNKTFLEIKYLLLNQ